MTFPALKDISGGREYEQRDGEASNQEC
ncbi:uncharacterized protein METZ01_LOCUS153877 [marine metagenome]|uniref:Uncharacterized protein n=1 Tax=marine metagenome TaxID=408172 RepID=A0A382AJ50_9ZZZZ